MRISSWLPVLALLTLFPQPLFSAIIMSRDDARQCYLGTLSELPAEKSDFGLKACDRAIANEDSDTYLRAALLVNRSDIRLRMQDYKDAVRDADASIALEPDLATAYLNRGAGLIGLKQYRDALSSLEKAIALSNGEKLQVAFFNRGLARDYLGDLQGAYFDYKKAIDLDPAFQPAQDQLTRFSVTVKSN
jgi:tetratricopeptide (TPR) repeat protein